jgi:hypothetical protein
MKAVLTLTAVAGTWWALEWVAENGGVFAGVALFGALVASVAIVFGRMAR